LLFQIKRLLMKLKLAFATFFTAFGLNAFAQTEKASLEAAPPVAVTPDSTAAAKAPETKMVVQPAKKVSYSLSAGAGFSGLGNYSYVSPAVYYRLNPKWSVFSRLTYLNSNFSFANPERQPMATKNYLLHAGAAYQVSERLQLSGSIWRDFSGNTRAFSGSGLRQPAIYGTEFNAYYKITEHLSITGSIRTSSGTGLMPYNPYFSPSPQLGF
jgi:hypothetical protein